MMPLHHSETSTASRDWRNVDGRPRQAAPETGFKSTYQAAGLHLPCTSDTCRFTCVHWRPAKNSSVARTSIGLRRRLRQRLYGVTGTQRQAPRTSNALRRDRPGRAASKLRRPIDQTSEEAGFASPPAVARRAAAAESNVHPGSQATVVNWLQIAIPRSAESLNIG